MDDKKKLELNDDQLEAVSGGAGEVVIVQPMGFKYCAADRTHVYPEVLDACPVCGTKEFTYK